MSFLTIKNLFKQYKNVEILKNISLSIDRGDFLVLVGPSGCGKSTLLSIIAGLEDLSDGEIYIDGKNVENTHPSNRDIAMVFQSYALYPNMTVEKNLAFGLEMHKVPADVQKQRIKEVAEMLQISDYLQRKPSALSGGQRQRVAMGRALVRQPKIFLFDEPLSNLDAKLRVTMRSEIKRIHKKLDVTMVYVTHDQIEAMTLSTKIAVMYQGVIQQLGTAHQIYNHPNNVFVAQFMGSPPMNILKGVLQSADEGLMFAMSEGKKKAQIPVQGAFPKHYINQEVLLGIRPEAIHPHQHNQADHTHKNNAVMQVDLDLVEPAGADCFAIMSLLGQSFTARFDGNFQAESGSTLDIGFKSQQMHFFDAKTEQNIFSST